MRISRDRMANWAPGDQDAWLFHFIPARDYEDLNLQDEQLRAWLPNAAKLALEEVAERAETSVTAYVTEYFAAHLYGHHELLRMRETRTGLYEPFITKRFMMSAGVPEQPPTLWKNIFALKIFIPEKIKHGLQALAIRAELGLGEFTRALLCAHLFGLEYGPQKFVTLSPEERLFASTWEATNAEENEDDQ